MRFESSAVLAVTISAVWYGHLLSFGGDSPLLQHLRNALHGPAFLLLSVIVWQALHVRFTTGVSALVTAATVLAVAIGGETLQYMNGSSFSPGDFAFDLLGCAIALLYFVGRAARRGLVLRPMTGRILQTGAYLLLVALILPVAWWSAAIGARATAMPQLMNPQFPWWRATIVARASSVTKSAPPAGWPSDIGPLLRVETAAAGYAGVALPDPYSDWRGFAGLSFLAASGDGRERRLRLRIHDAAHDQSYEDRFNRSWDLGRPVEDDLRQGIDKPRKFCIPLSDIEHGPAGRDMRLDQIAGLVFFVTKAQPGDVFLLADVRLEQTLDGSCND